MTFFEGFSGEKMKSSVFYSIIIFTGLAVLIIGFQNCSNSFDSKQDFNALSSGANISESLNDSEILTFNKSLVDQSLRPSNDINISSGTITGNKVSFGSVTSWADEYNGFGGGPTYSAPDVRQPCLAESRVGGQVSIKVPNNERITSCRVTQPNGEETNGLTSSDKYCYFQAEFTCPRGNELTVQFSIQASTRNGSSYGGDYSITFVPTISISQDDNFDFTTSSSGGRKIIEACHKTNDDVPPGFVSSALMESQTGGDHCFGSWTQTSSRCYSCVSL